MAKLSMQELAAQYGYAAAFFNQDKELQKLIQDAVRGQWSTQNFQARFMNTNYYRTHEAAVRQWTDLSLRDPAEAASKIHDKKLEVAQRLGQLGINMSDADLTWVASSALREGWTEQGMKTMLATYTNYQPGHAGGTPATLEMQIKGLANDYGMTATDAQLKDWVNGMLTDRYSKDNITSYLKDMAKSKYAGMGSYLDQGMTVKQVAQPYLNSYSNLLEVSADSIDMNDNIIQQALQGTPGAPNQPPAMQSVYQFEKALRRDPRWGRTKNAMAATVSAGQGVLKDWGLIG